MQLRDLAGRMQRLAQLRAGFSREMDLWRKVESPLHADERRQYLDAICEALRGIRNAYPVPGEALRRISRAG